MLALTDTPYRFSINHDIRPPKLAPCPVEYNWTRKDRCGIIWRSRVPTKKWLTAALLHGYTVFLVGSDQRTEKSSSSIAIARRRAEYHQAPKVPFDDADIPF